MPKADLAVPISLPSQTGRGWPKPGAALGLVRPLCEGLLESDLAEVSAALFDVNT